MCDVTVLNSIATGLAILLYFPSPYHIITTETTYVPKEGSSCLKCEDGSKAACKKCPDTIMIAAESGVEFQIAGSTIYEIGPDGPIHTGKDEIEGKYTATYSYERTHQLGLDMIGGGWWYKLLL